MERTMRSFLEESKTALMQLPLYQTIRVVLGNGTCDLDSAVCTLAQGFLEHVNIENQPKHNIAVIPVMNIPEKEFRLKTEVTYWLNYHNIPLNLLIFRDQINLQNIQNDAEKKLELILVDHHILTDEDVKLKSSIVTIIDHRPFDSTSLSPNISLNIELVGSCTTLVARSILQKNPAIMNTELSSFLRGPILVDTCNMSATTKRATNVDIDILNTLEHFGGLVVSSTNRLDVFNKIMNAKTDISELTLEELMLKDLKIANGIPIAVFPILVKDFLTQNNAIETIEKFGIDRNYTIIILIGINVCSECVSKDIAVFTISFNPLGNHIIEALTSSTQPDLKLEIIKEIQEEKYNLYLYKIGNLEITRKVILPLVQKAKLLFNYN